MITRRDMLRAASLLGLTGVGAGLLALPSRSVSAADYRALVVIELDGGNDSHNLIVPTDAAYLDYEKSRTSVLALPKDSLVKLDKPSAGHSLGMHPALKNLAAAYNRERLSVIAGVGALIEPITVAQARDRVGRYPPGLMSHSDQRSFVQGSTVDASGWAGRGLERLSADLRHVRAAISMNNNGNLVQGQTTPVSKMGSGGNPWWGGTNILEDERSATQSINRMTNWQFTNEYQRIYAKTLASAYQDGIVFAKADQMIATPAENFGSSRLGESLRFLAKVLPYMRNTGMRRQVFFARHGGFDTHTTQRGSAEGTQDTLLSELDTALSALDQSLIRNGLGDQVLVLVISEFGRTLSPGSGGGSEHAWDNHWMLMGGAAKGGLVHGALPTLVSGGPDDFDRGSNGRFVPKISADQVGASVMQWLGLESSKFGLVFPNLANFKEKTLPILKV